MPAPDALRHGLALLVLLVLALMGEVVEKYFADHKPLLNRHDRLLSCSDVIETAFGHYKNKGGMKVISSDVLYLPLLAHSIDLKFIHHGLGTVTQEMVNTWHERHTCDNRYSILRRMRQNSKPTTAVA